MLQRRRGERRRDAMFTAIVCVLERRGIGEALVDHLWTAYDTSPDEALGYAYELASASDSVLLDVNHLEGVSKSP